MLKCPHRHSLHLTQTGITTPINQVRTGSNNTGTTNATPLGFVNPNGLVSRGSAGSTGGGWFNAGTTVATTARPIYVLSDIITVVPETSSFALLTGTLAIAGFMIRRRRA